MNSIFSIILHTSILAPNITPFERYAAITNDTLLNFQDGRFCPLLKLIQTT